MGSSSNAYIERAKAELEKAKLRGSERRQPISMGNVMNAEAKVVADEALSTALADAFAEFEGASKDRVNPAFRSKYADLPAVIDAVKPALVKNRLFFTQNTHESGDGVCVETVVHHAAGGSLSFGRLFIPASKKDAHGFGSALTYARRYSLMTAFGIPMEDDDGNAATKARSADTKPINDAQFATLVTLIENVGADTRRFLDYFEVDTLKNLPASRYDDAVKALQAKRESGK